MYTVFVLIFLKTLYRAVNIFFSLERTYVPLRHHLGWTSKVLVVYNANYKSLFYRKIHYLTREFHVKLHAKTDIARIAQWWVWYRFSSAIQRGIPLSDNGFSLNRITEQKSEKKENGNNIVCFYPERALKEAISKSTVRTVFALANRKQGQSYTFDPSTTFFVLCACFYICFQTLLHVNKLHTNRKDK